MKKIFVIYGSANSGKTSTVKSIYDYFHEKYNAVETNLNKKLWKEILLTIDVNGHKIGFFSRGDNPDDIINSLEILINVNSEIIVCAVRKNRNDTQKNALMETVKKYNYNESDVVFESIERTDKTEPNDFKKAIKLDAKNHLIEQIEKLISK